MATAPRGFVRGIVAGVALTLLTAPQALAETKLTFGVLPVVQALPVFVAAEKGFFDREGIGVELVTFNSAVEKDIALAAGQIQGYFGDLQTCLIVTAGRKAPLSMVAVLYNSTGNERMFGILQPPKAPARPLAELAKEGIAAASGTVPHFLPAKLLSPADPGAATLTLIETKSIPIRLQMLMSNQVPAAALPEPLVTLAESQGARVVGDDRGKGISPTVLAFTPAYLSANPDMARRFLKAVAAASDYCNKNPEEVRPIMNRNGRVPESLRERYPIPAFPELSLPSREQVEEVAAWLRKIGIIPGTVTYADSVAGGFLP
jgi:NitT/TauT family transport system substrate-binding protein